ncbi:O-antigen ligase family protein [Wenyingzhuangia sp.]|uniref:O-antigen ligase family protein n=1 Tax=Wenyingzhuangia sp. TaxID=1964193 RepID=UPI00321B3E90
MLKNRLLLVVLHLLCGFFLTLSFIPKLVAILVMFYAIVDITKSKNDNHQAFLWASYFVSAEVLLRMTGGTISWEMVKYVTIIFLSIGILVERQSREFPVLFWLYILLLLLGISFSEIPAGESLRKAIVFNLSGPITLGVSAMYFYRRVVDYHRFKEILFFSLLPILSMLTLLYFRAPSLKELTFGSSANFVASGGFGPNQVSTALGFGLFLFATLLLLRGKITGFIYIDIFLLFYLTYRGLLTFSRGGMLTGFLAFVLFSIFYLIGKHKLVSLFKYLGIMSLFFLTIWLYSSNVTGGRLSNRYLGKDYMGVQNKDITTGRLAIMRDQLNAFLEHPFFGLGVGSGKYSRLDEYDQTITIVSHNEITRLLEEHGLIGLFSLLLLFYAVMDNFRQQDIRYKGFVLGFATLWFLTISHSAMRIAFPGFVYGLSLIRFYDSEDKEDDHLIPLAE